MKIHDELKKFLQRIVVVQNAKCNAYLCCAPLMLWHPPPCKPLPSKIIPPPLLVKSSCTISNSAKQAFFANVSLAHFEFCDTFQIQPCKLIFFQIQNNISVVFLRTLRSEIHWKKSMLLGQLFVQLKYEVIEFLQQYKNKCFTFSVTKMVQKGRRGV